MAETEYGIRKWLQDRGYADEDIGWDDARKTVMLQGKSFMAATPRADWRTYATGDQLNTALNTFRNNQLQDQTFQSLNNLQNKLTAEPFQYQQYQPFSYNPDEDPGYQAALRTAQSNAASGQNNALAKLRSMGQGKSSYSETLAHQIGQRELGKVTDQALPQLLAQAYQRYTGDADRDFRQQQAQYGAQQDAMGQLHNLAGLTSGLSQQNLDNQFRTSQASQNQANIEADRNYQAARDAIMDERYKVQFDEDARRFGLQFAQEKAIQQGQLDISKFNADTSRMGAQTSQMNAETSRMQANQSQERLNSEKQQAEAARAVQTQIMSGFQSFDNAQEADAWLNANAGYITQNLGADTFAEMKRMLPYFYGTDQSQAQAETAARIRQQAVEMASKQATWSNMNEGQKEAAVQHYIKLLGG